MRTMIRVKVPVESGNHGIKNGTLQKVVGEAMERLRPEAAYFYPEQGVRCALMIVNMEDASQIPTIAEPFFMALNASVELIPVMNAEDLKKGLSQIPQ